MENVIGITKLHNDCLAERWVFVKGEALADKIQNANFH